MIGWFKSWWSGADSGWRVFAPYSHWDVKRNAHADATLPRPVPGPDDVAAPQYLVAMKQHFSNIVKGIGAQCQEKVEPLSTRARELQTQKIAADRDFPGREAAHKKANEEFEKANPSLHASGQVGRAIAYWMVAVIFFFIPDLFLNYSAFLIFGDKLRALTGAAAVTIGVIIVVSAHFMGIEWRRGPFKPGHDNSAFLTTLILPVLTVVCVAWLRTIYFSHQTHSEAASVSSMALFWPFLVFNLAMYGAACVLSRWANPVGNDLVIKREKELKKARKLVDTLGVQLDSVNKIRQLQIERYKTEAYRVITQHNEQVNRYLMENVRVQKGEGLDRDSEEPTFMSRLFIPEPPMFRRKYDAEDVPALAAEAQGDDVEPEGGTA